MLSLTAYKLNQLWKQSGLSFRTKSNIYRSTVLSSIRSRVDLFGKEYAQLNIFKAKRLKVIVDKNRGGDKERGAA